MNDMRRIGLHGGVAAGVTVGWLLTATAALSATMARAADEAVPDPATTTPAVRPRIGLVLGGGGAKGAAHIGVLKVLEELRVPVDCVAGTSMGALVGAGYAAGATVEELESVITGIDWSRTFGGGAQRIETPIHRKATQITYSNGLNLGLKDGEVVSAGGLLRTQEVEEMLRLLVERARLETDFDKLPLPFRAVATDMRNSEMVVLDSGDLSVAMRASMAVPGVFAPVITEDRILSDGGMMRNVPVDIARDLCAEVVIVSNLESPPPRPEDLTSALALIGRSVDVMIDANVKAQMATLTERDVAIHVQMGDLGTGDFHRVTEAVPKGEVAARAVADELRRYSVPEAQYQAWRQAVTAQPPTTVAFSDIRITGTERVNPDYVRGRMELQVGEETTAQQIAEDTQRIYSLGDFERVEYKLTGDAEKPTLEIGVTEKTWGPDFLAFDLGLHASSGGDLSFVLRAEHLRTWINDAGAEWQSAVQIGRKSLLETTYYQPLDAQHRFFIEPSAMAYRSLEDVYVDGDRVARYDLREAYANLDGGIALGTVAELRAGLRYGVASARVDTGPTTLPPLDTSEDAAWTARFFYDSRDAPLFATRGMIARARYVRSDPALGSDFDYEQIDGGLGYAFPLRGNILHLAAMGGTDLDSDPPPYREFRLGGLLSFPGLEIAELRGNEYWATSAFYLWKLADIQSIFGQAIYAGLRLTAGEMSERVDGVDDGTIYGAALVLGGRTPLGPVALSLGTSSTGSQQLYLSLGRPVEEGTIADDF